MTFNSLVYIILSKKTYKHVVVGIIRELNYISDYVSYFELLSDFALSVLRLV